MTQTLTNVAETDNGIEWVLPSYFMFRMAGLPMDAVTGLRTPGTVSWADRTVRTERELRRRAAAVTDGIESVVAGVGADTVRRQLLGLRRDIHNLRLPGGLDDLGTIVAALPAGVGQRLREWIELRRAHEAHLAQGEETLRAELLSARHHLQGLAQNPKLRAGLLLASPSLDRYLGTYLEADLAKPNKRARRIEQSVLEYVYRTACKTSPFSYLTTVGLGTLEEDEWSFLRAVTDVVEQSFPRLNLAVLGRISDILMEASSLRSDLPVSLTSGWRLDQGRVRYVRREHRAGDDDATVTMDVLQESLFYLTSGQVLAEVLADMTANPTMRFGDLAEVIRTRDPEERSRADVDAYLQNLVRLGLLTIPSLRIDIHSANPVRAFIENMVSIDRAWAHRLAGRLDAVAGQVDEFAVGDLATRRRLIGSLRQGIEDVQRSLGKDEPSVPKTLVFEDVSVGTGQVKAGRRAWSRHLVPALDGLARILPVFDITLPQRLVTKGYFRARYGLGGQCGDVLKFVHEFHQEFYDQYLQTSMRRRTFDDNNDYVPQENWLRLPEIEALDDARTELIRRMREESARASEGDDLILGDEFVDAVAARLPKATGRLEPRCFFLQVADDGGEPLVVLNRAYTGLTLLFSRFTHCFGGDSPGGLSGALRGTLESLQTEGTVFAELKGGYETSNLNLHSAVTPYELVCPGDVSMRPAEQQIPVEDLYVEDDPEADHLRLRSRRLGLEVVPVYLGFLMPIALPDVQRLLLNFSYTSMAMLDLWSGTDVPLGERSIGGHPRVRYRNLVIQRRLWKTRPETLPTFEHLTGQADRFLAWRRWAADNGLPNRVFATPDMSGDIERPSEDPGGRPAMAGTMKPQYVDFESPLSLGLLDKLVKSANQRLVFTEMLPDFDQLWVRGDGGRYVTELTVEADGVQRGTR